MNNSNFYHGHFNVSQLGGPEEWEANGGKPNWILNEDMSYYFGKKALKAVGAEDHEGIKITMQAGFITDGGSYSNALVPSVGSQTGNYFRAYALHDIIARTKHFTFSQSNIVLDETLELLKMSWWARQKVYYPLQWAGSPVKDPELLSNAERHIVVDRYESIVLA